MAATKGRPIGSSKQENDFRIKEAYELICRGEVSYDIERHFTAKYNIKKRQADHYIAGARKLLAEDFRKQKPYYLQEIIKRLEGLYKQAKKGVECMNERGQIINRVELTTARQCLADIAKISGLVVNRVKIEDHFVDDETLDAYRTLPDDEIESQAE